MLPLLSRFHAVCGTLFVLITATFTAAKPPIWETTPTLPITYRTGAIFYRRSNFPSPRVPFIVKFWWLGLILVCAVAVVLYGALLLWICVHFKVREQHKARHSIAASYANGTFQKEALEGRNQPIVCLPNGRWRRRDRDQCSSNGEQESGGSSEAQAREQSVILLHEEHVHGMPTRETSHNPFG